MEAKRLQEQELRRSLRQVAEAWDETGSKNLLNASETVLALAAVNWCTREISMTWPRSESTRQTQKAKRRHEGLL